MKTASLLLFICCSIFSVALAQPIEKMGRGYYQNGERLSYFELVSVMESQKEAQSIMISAREYNNNAYLMSFVGVSLVTADIIKMSRSDDFLPMFGVLTYSGLAVVLAGGIFKMVGMSRRENAVLLYNSNVRTTTKRQINPEIEIAVRDNGVGFRVSF